MKPIEDLQEIASLVFAAKSIILQSGASHPAKVAQQLEDHAALWPHLEVYTFMPLGPCPFVRRNGLTTKSGFPGRRLRKEVMEGTVSPIRESLGAHARAYRDGTIKIDIAVLQVAPPDRDGIVRLGPSVDFMPDTLATAPLVIAVFNSNVPRCGPAIETRQIDYVLNDNAMLPEADRAVVDDTDRQIVEHVCDLLDTPKLTLEAGIGAVPEAVMRKATRIPRLRIHSGLLNDSIMDIAGRLDRPPVATLVAGTGALYEYLDGSSAIDLRPATFTHAIETIASIPAFHAVNGALQVDVSGAVNTEIVGGRFVSTPGGLPDFANGAQQSTGGKSIIALRSTARKNGASALVPKVECRSLDGKSVDFIVTEYGVADLRNGSAHEHAKRLCAIAHPDHRDELQRAVAMQ